MKPQFDYQECENVLGKEEADKYNEMYETAKKKQDKEEKVEVITTLSIVFAYVLTWVVLTFFFNISANKAAFFSMILPILVLVYLVSFAKLSMQNVIVVIISMFSSVFVIKLLEILHSHNL